jgi:Anthrax toxin lethal factor, N- and C-terminal domain
MNKLALILIAFSALASVGINTGLAEGKAADATRPRIIQLDPPLKGFFAKELMCHGIPIMAPAVVADKALYVAYDRISRQLEHLPMVASNLVASGVQVHIIGRHQVTSDLPEFRNLKGKPLPEYHGETIDQRTRGLGGRLTSVGEENLLKLKSDHYYGRDILTHEFAHAIRQYGIPLSVVHLFNEQYRRSLAKGLWKGAYAASNADEFFAELSMWYFGTHGDLHMTGPKPANGPEGLKKYDPQAYKLFDQFYTGRIPIGRVAPGGHPWTGESDTTNRPPWATRSK